MWGSYLIGRGGALVSGRDFPRRGSADPTTSCLWEQGGGRRSLAKGEGEGLGRLLRLLRPHHKKGTG